MEEAGIITNEQVHVLNLENGQRIVTYAIPAASGVIGINGAAAHLFEVGDKIIICAYAQFADAELEGHEPRVVLVDTNNRSKGCIRAGLQLG